MTVRLVSAAEPMWVPDRGHHVTRRRVTRRRGRHSEVRIRGDNVASLPRRFLRVESTELLITRKICKREYAVVVGGSNVRGRFLHALVRQSVQHRAFLRQVHASHRGAPHQSETDIRGLALRAIRGKMGHGQIIHKQQITTGPTPTHHLVIIIDGCTDDLHHSLGRLVRNLMRDGACGGQMPHMVPTRQLPEAEKHCVVPSNWMRINQWVPQVCSERTLEQDVIEGRHVPVSFDPASETGDARRRSLFAVIPQVTALPKHLHCLPQRRKESVSSCNSGHRVYERHRVGHVHNVAIYVPALCADIACPPFWIIRKDCDAIVGHCFMTHSIGMGSLVERLTEKLREGELRFPWHVPLPPEDEESLAVCRMLQPPHLVEGKLPLFRTSMQTLQKLRDM
mmetsp:Transcript_78863/g.219277  ORF Transcript_78863/g.219277 Transcript_78863/m.219277 type:complete len:395 (+) Transcript_78863:423-1607(+)